MRLHLDLDRETSQRLLQAALAERRPIVWQAEIMLRRALGVPVPAERVPAAAHEAGARCERGQRAEGGK